MKPTDDNLPSLDDRQLDLLVDGELPEDQRRNLLATLDDVPGGWRRCALAFLEAQCWKEELASIPHGLAPGRQTRSADRRRPSSAGRWRTVLAMAASFLVALGLGLLLRDVWHSPRERAPGPIDVAGTGGTDAPAPEPERPQDASPDDLQGPASGERPWQLVPVALDGGTATGGSSIWLPAVERDHLDDAWPESLPAAIPPEVLEALRQRGHQIRQQRQLLPLRTQDGRRLVVPVNELEFRYRGPSHYQ